MPTKKQHYVSKVYLKSWETKVETKKEPQKKFYGVYKFESGETIGDGCNRNSILWKPHLYTISFRQLYLSKKCPLIHLHFILNPKTITNKTYFCKISAIKNSKKRYLIITTIIKWLIV